MNILQEARSSKGKPGEQEIQTKTVVEKSGLKHAPWWEIIIVMALSLGISLLFPALKIFGVLIPIGYLVVEGHVRRRTWAEIGFSFRTIPASLKKNIGWILLVSVVIQAVAAFGATFFLPAYAQHIVARLPFDLSTLRDRVF